MSKSIENTENHSSLDAKELAMYQQAHETRRKWESYIWSWGILVTALVSVMTGFVVIPGKAGTEVTKTVNDVGIEWLRRFTLLLLSTFLASILMNVYRARHLMKKLEITIQDFHKRWHINDLPIVPLEIDRKDKNRLSCFSSTKLSVYAHFLAFLLIAGLTILEFLGWKW